MEGTVLLVAQLTSYIYKLQLSKPTWDITLIVQTNLDNQGNLMHITEHGFVCQMTEVLGRKMKVWIIEV